MHKSLKTYQFFNPKILSKYSNLILFSFLIIATFSDFIANERPIYAKVSGQTYFPVFHQYGEYLGLKPYEFIKQKSWDEIDYEICIKPLIPFSPYNISQGDQSLQSPSKIHFLGTDAVGRDVASGIIQGARLALLIGFLASFITVLLGVIVGLIAGYFGDQMLRLSPIQLLLMLLFSFLTTFYIWYSTGIGYLFWGSFLVLGNLLIYRFLDKVSYQTFPKLNRLKVPVDLIINRCIEVFKALPNLLILLTFVTFYKITSIYGIAILLGVLSWPNVARITRAEVLRVREQEYVISAQMLGLSHTKLMWSQIFPNIISPILVAFIFGVSGAIMAEATLSFLGIGISIEQVTWGSILNAARNNIQAWWLAIFPGLCIFLIINSLNNIANQFLAELRN